MINVQFMCLSCKLRNVFLFSFDFKIEKKCGYIFIQFINNTEMWIYVFIQFINNTEMWIYIFIQFINTEMKRINSH